MDDDILQEFLAESWENLARLDNEIIELEKRPNDTELLASIFRTIHTIKGTCGFIGLTELGSVAHSAENVLGKMRDGVLAVTEDAISLVLEAVDCIKDLLKGLEATGKEPAADNSRLIASLDALAEGGSSSAETTELTNSAKVETPEPVLTPAAEASNVGQTTEISETDPIAVPPSEPEPAQQVTPKADVVVADSNKKSVADLSIRVNVDVLDSLMNLVGELVLTRNQLMQLARGDDESKYAAPITHLNRVTTDLQEGVMKTRMQPVGNAWSKLPRLVRDLSKNTGKQIELIMTGAETELDRTVLDAIKDPLTHMVRNSADHGVESPEVRKAVGKPETGKVKLNACHEGGHVIISIQDDGAGINLEKVRSKAVQQGLVSEADVDKKSDYEVLQYIFNAGFSTAEKVSAVSGRGVGMDVVRTNIEKIGGTVDLMSTTGTGSTIRIKIPLTLAIISAVVVESSGETFAIPQLAVVELVRLAAEDKHKIERIHENEVFRLRDRLLPLVHLDQLLGLESQETEEQDVNIVVVQVDSEQFGLIVSEVFDTEEIVVKPMGSLLKDIDIYQGATILGDGRVIMILDVVGIASRSGSLPADGDIEETTNADEGEGEITSVLLFNAGDETTMAVPLSLVARLEEFSRDKIEQTGERLVVQYREDLLPLLPIAGRTQSGDAPNPQPVIVFSEGTSSMGLMVEEIQDIRQERLDIRMQSQKPGILGTAIINGKATDVIDTQYYVIQANPDWFVSKEKSVDRKILVIDDSVFFRQLVTTTLETVGYDVIAVDNGKQAISILEKGKQFDLIVSDIDMPLMNGCEFAQWVRNRPDMSKIPLIAITAHNEQTHENRAVQAGFDRFLAKFDADRLLALIEELCMESKLNTGAIA